MLWLKKKTEEMVREWVALLQEREDLKGDNEWMFDELEQATPWRRPRQPCATTLRCDL